MSQADPNTIVVEISEVDDIVGQVNDHHATQILAQLAWDEQIPEIELPVHVEVQE